jgi:two-component system chemotaxis response regulator CheY
VEGKKILVVEDSKLVHKMFEVMLRRCNLVHCYDGLDALQKLADHPDAALILLDLNMPRMTGLEFLHRIKGDPVFSKIPVVIVSTEGKDEDTERGLKAGAAAYITKPFQQEEIVKVISRLTEDATA